MNKITLGDLSDNFRKVRRIVGRGDGSTRGNKCGRGQKGQKAHGKIPRVGFSGGQRPFYIAPKKLGVDKRWTMEIQRNVSLLPLSRVQQWIDAGRLDATKPITMKELFDSKAVQRRKQGVKVIDEGCHLLKSKIQIETTMISSLAARAVEGLGGKAVSVYYSPLNYRALIYPHYFRILPRRSEPTKTEIINFYQSEQNRGYIYLKHKPTYPAPTAKFFAGLSKPFQFNHKLINVIF